MEERDGTIVIDTQIDTKGVDAGSEKTEASLRRIHNIDWSKIVTNVQDALTNIQWIGDC